MQIRLFLKPLAVVVELTFLVQVNQAGIVMKGVLVVVVEELATMAQLLLYKELILGLAAPLRFKGLLKEIR
jgi:hypothetical protein